MSAEIILSLNNLCQGLTTDRSLEGAPKDVQCFELFVTGEWRESFDKIYAALAPKPNVNEVLKQGRLRGATGRPKLASTKPTEGSLKASRELTLFLKEFIENNFGKGNGNLYVLISEKASWLRSFVAAGC